MWENVEKGKVWRGQEGRKCEAGGGHGRGMAVSWRIESEETCRKTQRKGRFGEERKVGSVRRVLVADYSACKEVEIVALVGEAVAVG